MRPEDLHDMARGYITAALWTDAMPLCTCGAHDSVDQRDHDTSTCKAEESGGLEHLEVRAEDYVYVRELCERFARAAGAALVVYSDLRAFAPEEGSVWSYIGHDLRLTSAGHGTGFWDRDPEPTNMREGDDVRFATARAELSELARQSPFHREGGGDVWQATEGVCHFDHWSLELNHAPGDRWEPPTLTSAQRQAWIEEGIVPTLEEMPV